MRHATKEDLDRLETLLQQVRNVAGLIEKKRGVFYLKSRAFLHFHEHEGVAYADVRLTDGDFSRVAVRTAEDKKHLVSAIRQRVMTVSGSGASTRSSSRPSTGLQQEMPDGTAEIRSASTMRRHFLRRR